MNGGATDQHLDFASLWPLYGVVYPSSPEQLLRRIATSDCGGSLPTSSSCQPTGVDQLIGIVHGAFQQSLESLRRFVEDTIPWDAS